MFYNFENEKNIEITIYILLVNLKKTIFNRRLSNIIFTFL